MRSKSIELMNKIVEFIDNHFEFEGRTPTYREIANEFQIASSCVSGYINEMAKREMLTIQNGSRGIITAKMKKSNNDISNLAVVGSIACGTPLLAEQNIEKYLSVPRDFLGSGNHFVLVANGNSMIDAGISNGDYVIVRQQETAEEGQIVVALIDNEATLKRYYLDKKRKKVRLHPENSTMEDRFFDNIVIQGVAVKVIKDLN